MTIIFEMTRAREIYISSMERVFGRRVEFPEGVSLWIFACFYAGKAFFPLLRGLWERMFMRKAGWPLFVGHGVKLRFARFLEVGRSVNLGDRVRIDSLSTGGVHLGDRVSIREGGIIQLTSHLSHLGESVNIEHDVYIGPYAFIGAAAPVRIGARTLIGPKLTIIAEQHVFEGMRSVFDQGVSRAGVLIGSDCWIGANVTILDGVEIGANCVVGAGSVVTRSIPAGAVAFGSPARVHRMRQSPQESRSHERVA